MSFTFEYNQHPPTDSDAKSIANFLNSKKADAWSVSYVRSMTGEPARDLVDTALEALALAEQLYGAEPHMIATLRPLYYKD